MIEAPMAATATRMGSSAAPAACIPATTPMKTMISPSLSKTLSMNAPSLVADEHGTEGRDREPDERQCVGGEPGPAQREGDGLEGVLDPVTGLVRYGHAAPPE